MTATIRPPLEAPPPSTAAEPDAAPERRTFGSLKLRGRIWWIRYRVGGTDRAESTRSTSRRTAEKPLARREAEFGLNAFVEPSARRVRFEDLAQIIRDNYRLEGRKSADTLETLLKRLGQEFASVRAVTITADRLAAYARRRLDAGAAGSTIRNELNALRRAFRLARRLGRVAQVPEFPTVRIADPRAGFFEQPALDAILAELPTPLRPLILFAYLTGWRIPSEVMPLAWPQVDLDARVVRLEPGTTENGQARTFPFALLPALGDLLDQQREYVSALERRLGRVIPHVFVRDTGDRIRDFYHAWHAACRRAAVAPRDGVAVVVHPELLDRPIPHDFRRTAVRNLVRAGVPRSIARLLTGHKTESVFERYNITSEQDLADGVEKLAAYLAAKPAEDARRRAARGTLRGQSALGGQ